nr:RNA-directed DNA polymerase, eukaryota [Tanacetum cinerariifolium]
MLLSDGSSFTSDYRSIRKDTNLNMGQWHSADEYDGQVREITFRCLCNSPMCPPDTAMTEWQHILLSQKNETFWYRVLNEFNSKFFQKRTKDMLTSKWHTLNANCQKFNTAYKRAKRLGRSGENDVDVLKRAQSIYHDEHKGVAFCQEDAWAILKFHPKWDAPEQVDLTEDVPGATQAKRIFSVMMHDDQELRLKREAAERAFEIQVEKHRTLMRLEELWFLATSTKDLDDADAYWIKKQTRLIRNKMRNDLGDEDDEDESNALRNLTGKLKNLKNDIRVWNKTKGNSNRDAKAQLKLELDVVDLCIDNGNGTVDDIKRRGEIVNKLQDIDKLHALETAQKAKVKWAVEGDENFSFFMVGVMSDGVWVDNPIKISEDQKRDLEGEVTNDEIKKAVWDCGTDKALGPDGFTFGFYRKFWDLIDNDVCDAVRFFFKNDNIPNGCNSSFIALIPKIPDANMVKDFRPISLVGSVYKIIAKILVNRLVGVLGDIVSEVQLPFIADRQILDGPFILNEVLQWCKNKKKQALIFKVDFEKAYDSVRWDFLDEVLNKFGFGEKWCRWIQACLKSSRGSVIINGSPTKEFQFGKGLKQGDPLSPFLFLFIMETCIYLFNVLWTWGCFRSEGNINSLVNILECFNMAPGLKINMRKSKIMGVHVTIDKVNKAATKLGCFVLKAPFLYLGSMVGGAMSRSKSWYEVVDRVKKRLSKWKLKTLSIGGRLPLLKSVLVSISIFHMSMCRVPMGVLRTLESLRSHFLMGMILIVEKRLGLNGRCKDSSLWAKVIMAIHGSDGKVEVCMKAGTRSCWLNILYEVNVLSKKGIDLKKFMRFKVGNGENIMFWDDTWNEGESSKEFTMASVRKLIDDKWLPGADNKTRWIKYVPIKINVHAWKVMSDSIPTRFNISRREISIDSLSCVLCDNRVRHLITCFFPVALSDKCLGSLCDDVKFLRLNLSRTLDGWIG